MEHQSSKKGPIWLAIGALAAAAILGTAVLVGERMDDTAATTGGSTSANDPGSIQDLPSGSKTQRERADP
jgi:hypothetical protein